MNRTYHTICPICRSSSLEHHLKVQDYTVSGETYELVRCSDCGFILTQDAPDAESIGPYYKSETYVSHSDTKKGIFFKAYHWAREIMLNQKYKQIVKRLPKATESELLDIGCGRAYFLNFMSQKGFICTGIEQDAEVRKNAINQFGLNVLPTSALYNLPEKKFDVITLWHVLEHVHDLQAYLNQIKLLLKPNGLLVIALPNPVSADVRHYGKYWSGWDVPIHLWHFTPQNIQDLLSQYQFKLIDKKTMPFDPFYLSILSSGHQSKSLPTLRGLFNGKIFLIKSWFNVDKSSSITYFFQTQ